MAGPLGHFAMGIAAKPLASKVGLPVLFLAGMFLDFLFIGLAYLGAADPNSWSHGLFMSVVWSLVVGLLTAWGYHEYRAGVVVGLIILSHWVLDLISHPIAFSSFSWNSWQWSYGHPLPPDLPLLFAGSPKFGFGLYNSISAVAATGLEGGMFLLGAAFYAVSVIGRRKESGGKVPEHS